MTPALPKLFELIYNSYKRGQSLIKLNRSINYTKQTNIMNIGIYHLHHRYVPLLGLDRLCGAHSSRPFVGPTVHGCGEVQVEVGVGVGVEVG